MSSKTAGTQPDPPVAVLAGDDATAIRDLLRRSHGSDVRAVAGTDPDGFIRSAPVTGPWALASVRDLAISATARQEAQRQLDLRQRGEQAVQGVLAALGHAFDGTGGWWISAFAAPDRTVGFVNTARGVAVSTSAVLGADVIEALTVPRQAEGPQVSGAASWASPDPGEAHQASAPAGWVQLVMDLRGGDAVTPQPGVTARIVAWCLRTCYGKPGDPGALGLDTHPWTFASSAGRADVAGPQDWPAAGDVRRAVDEAGLAVLDTIARDLAADAGVGGEIGTALDGDGPRWERIRAAWQAALLPAADFAGYEEPAQVAARAARRASAAALAPVARIAESCGDAVPYGPGNIEGSRYWDVIEALAARIITARLEPLMAPLAAAVPGQPRDARRERERLTDAVAGPVAELACSRARDGAADAWLAMAGAYRAGGPVAVDIPLPVPGHLPWDPSGIVGLEEIAGRLGVKRATADKWRTRSRRQDDLGTPRWQRNERLPEAPGIVGGRPAWPWQVISEWAIRTGRLLPGEILPADQHGP